MKNNQNSSENSNHNIEHDGRDPKLIFDLTDNTLEKSALTPCEKKLLKRDGEKAEKKLLILQKYQRGQRYVTYPSKEYNVILVGKTKEGKSTFIDTFHGRNIRFFEQEYASKSKTMYPIIKRVTFQCSDTNEFFVVNFLDSPGLFEFVDDKEMTKKRDNKQLMELIKEKIDVDITQIDLVVYVLDGIGPDKQSYDAIRECAKKMRDVLKQYQRSTNSYHSATLDGHECILATHMEDCSDKKMKQSKTRIREEFSKDLPRLTENDILFSGVLKDVTHYNFENETIQKRCERLVQFREEFIEYLRKLEDGRKLRQKGEQSWCSIS